ncbi:transposase [Consotaella aegiceratis]|uniref:transposase n=1 Tax=Consotaella aegiceratis TaxID=3097961 RepID=UPI003D805B92
MASIARKTKRYPTDLTDAEWTMIAPLLPKPAKRGRKPSVDMREIVSAIRYMTRSGGGWRPGGSHLGI